MELKIHIATKMNSSFKFSAEAEKYPLCPGTSKLFERQRSLVHSDRAFCNYTVLVLLDHHEDA